MTDQIETAVKAASDSQITVPRNAAVVVGGFAVYGVYTASRNAASKVQSILQNRKAKKAAEQAEKTPEQ